MNKRQTGFTLIELMIASFMSILILGGVLTLMSANKRTYSLQSDQIELQENARFAMQFLGRGLRMAGYFGCTNKPIPGVTGVVGLDEASDDLFGAGTIVGWTPPAQESDVFMVSFIDTDRNAFRIVHCPRDPNNNYIRRTLYDVDGTTLAAGFSDCEEPAGDTPNFRPTPLQATLNSFSMTGFDSILGNLAVGDTVVASDCVGSDVYTVTNTSPLTIDPALQRDYENGAVYYGAEMRRLTIQRFFVAENPAEEAPNGDKIYSLYRDNGGGYNPDAGFPSLTATPDLPGDADGDDPDIDNAEELISGVESMQLRWGEDTDNDGIPDIYRSADTVTDWNSVSSVRMMLLMRTPLRDIDPDTRPYTTDPASASANLNGYTPNDARRRVVFANSVFLRNNTLVPQ